MKSVASVRLAEIASPSGKRAGAEGQLPVYSVTKHRGFVPSLEYFSKQVFSRELSGYTIVEPGELAYASIHLDEGSIGICPERCLISPMYTAFRVDRRAVLPEYLIRYLKSPPALSEYPRFGQGSAERRRTITFERLGELAIPLPPLAEQSRIAAILDQADALLALRHEAIARLGAFVDAVFLEMFGDPSMKGGTWPIRRLGDVTETTSGGTPDRACAGCFGGSIPWVKSGELHQGLVTTTDEHLTERGLQASSARVMPPGTVLLAMYGATAGTVATLGIEAATNQAVCCMSPSKELDTPFLVHLLRRLARSILMRRVGGAQPNLSQELIRSVPVPVPPLTLQRSFAARVAVIEHLQADHRASLAKLNELFASLQYCAFRSEL